MSLFGVILVRIFRHSDWIRRDTEYLSVFSLNERKYRPGSGYAGIPTSYDGMKNVPASSKHNNKWLESSDLVYCPVSCIILSQLSYKQPLELLRNLYQRKVFYSILLPVWKLMSSVSFMILNALLWTSSYLSQLMSCLNDKWGGITIGTGQ